MPYIPKAQRPADIDSDALVNMISWFRSGKLNYAITMLCEQYREVAGDSDCTINTIIGALECAKLEYYRRVGVPYENSKLGDHGDVYAPLERDDGSGPMSGSGG